MKKRNIIAAASAAILCAACIPSVYPFYTNKDVVFDTRLVGEWREKDVTNNPDAWMFERSTNNAYKLTVIENGKSGEFSAYLFKLKQEEFLDIIPTRCDFATNQADIVGFAIIPGHLLVRVSEIEPEFKPAFFNFDWLEKYLEKNPKALAHHSEDGGVVLTADTRGLQRFVLKHLGTNELFKESGEFVKRTDQKP